MGIVSAAILMVAACSSDDIPGSPAGLPYAAATPTCGPTDGPAVAIYLSPSPVTSLDPAIPYVRIAVWQPLDRLRERTWTLGEGAATAGYFTTQNEFETASSGSVTVTTIDSDSTVRGSAVFTFPTRGTVTGGFRAHWLPVATLLCG
jgi:hypothetical protein